MSILTIFKYKCIKLLNFYVSLLRNVILWNVALLHYCTFCVSLFYNMKFHIQDQVIIHAGRENSSTSLMLHSYFYTFHPHPPHPHPHDWMSIRSIYKAQWPYVVRCIDDGHFVSLTLTLWPRMSLLISGFMVFKNTPCCYIRNSS